MTLTDEEKREMRESDERARQLLERTETLPAEQLMKLHGVLRNLRSVPAPESNVRKTHLRSNILRPIVSGRNRDERVGDGSCLKKKTPSIISKSPESECTPVAACGCVRVPAATSWTSRWSGKSRPSNALNRITRASTMSASFSTTIRGRIWACCASPAIVSSRCGRGRAAARRRRPATPGPPEAHHPGRGDRQYLPRGRRVRRGSSAPPGHRRIAPGSARP